MPQTGQEATSTHKPARSIQLSQDQHVIFYLVVLCTSCRYNFFCKTCLVCGFSTNMLFYNVHEKIISSLHV